MFLKSGRLADLVIFCAFIIATYYYYQLIKKGKQLPSIRTISALIAIEEGVGRAVETDEMVFFEPGRGGLTRGAEVPMSIAAMNILRYTSRLCARLGAKFQFGAIVTEIIPLAEAIVEESYRLEGKIDEYSRDMVRYFGSGPGGNLEQASQMVQEGCACCVTVGAFTTSILILLGASARSGAINIGGTGRWIMMYAFGIAADYILIMEDIYAASAIISEDPGAISSLAISDIIKIVIICIILIGIIMLGVNYNITNILTM